MSTHWQITGNRIKEKFLERIHDKLIFFECPTCHYKEGQLQIGEEENSLLCTHCQVLYPIIQGIPIFAKRPNGFIPHSIFTSQWIAKLRTLVRIVIGTPLWFLFLFFSSLIEKKNFFFGKKSNCVSEVRKWLPHPWVSRVPYNLYLKSVECRLFSGLEIERPSLEIGGGGGATSRLAFAGKRIDIDCEYFTDGLFTSLNNGDDIYECTDLHVGGTIYNLPFKNLSFNTVVMVHIADHLTEIKTALGELSRVLSDGGRLVFSTYSKSVFYHLPLFKLISKLSERWARRYLYWKCNKGSWWHGRLPFICNDPQDATGQNLYSISEWKELGESYGLKLIESRSFTLGSVWTTLMDLQYRGDPWLLQKVTNRFITHWVEKELQQQQILSEDQAANLFMVFQKTG